MVFSFSWPSLDLSLIWPDASLCLLSLWIGAAFLLGFWAALRTGEPKKVMSDKSQEPKNVSFNQRLIVSWGKIWRR
jgi:hypothetical protein